MSSFYDKIQGCWIGKNLAGAIGMPYEGVPYTVNLKQDEICLSDVPNDDLELQLVWLDALKKHGLNLTCGKLAAYWQDIIKHGVDEYSIALHNMKHGIMPPLSGRYNNFFADGMGATIRSEIWALIFAGRPDAAAYFAQQDAEVDHWGDGVRGEIFMATAESIACVTSDIESSLRSALEQIDRSSRLYSVLAEVFRQYDNGTSDEDARNYLLLNLQRIPNFTDCVMNLAFVVHSLLRGHGDFVKTVLMAISFGRDADCTAASAGAFLGIARGKEIFPPEWLEKMDEKLILSDFVSSVPGVPLTMTELVRQTAELHDELFKQLPSEPYPPYVPCKLPEGIKNTVHSKWLVLNGTEHDIAAIKKELQTSGKCPENLKSNIFEFNSFFMDLSRFAKNAELLHLFSFLTVDNNEVPQDEIVCSATADVGMRLWMDDRRLMNHHSRLKMLPSFHRAEGGAVFALPLQNGSRHLFHVELFSCLPPLQACIMFGNLNNDHLDGFDFDI
ncbi:MAG: ADP-ribosylglycohydrolase family protein [Lentisphaeria bacterium]|nr:ADP-ribosylglycohydrolase family protein [Lentisphaeria bacterium]